MQRAGDGFIRGEVADDFSDTVIEPEAVEAIATGHVIAGAADRDERVVADAASEGVIARAGEEVVVPAATDQRVIARAAAQGGVGRDGRIERDAVVAAIAVDDQPRERAGDRSGPGAVA